MFIMPAAPNGCHIVFIVHSCAMMAAVEWMLNVSLYEVYMAFRADCVMWLFIGV